MIRYAKLLVNEIQKVDAQPIFYMTWAAHRRPDTQDEITSVYRRIADQHNAILAPVGEAWRKVFETGEGIQLHDSDGRHASPVGSYLAACVLTSVMTNRPANGWPGKLVRHEELLIEVDDSQISTLQQAASEAIRDEQAR